MQCLFLFRDSAGRLPTALDLLRCGFCVSEAALLTTGDPAATLQPKGLFPREQRPNEAHPLDTLATDPQLAAARAAPSRNATLALAAEPKANYGNGPQKCVDGVNAASNPGDA